MKKFLFIVSFISVSNHLFSTPLFKKQFYEETAIIFINDIFLESPKAKKNSLSFLKFLKYVAKKYLQLSEDWKIDLHETIGNKISPEEKKKFELNSEQEAYVIEKFSVAIEEYMKNFGGAFLEAPNALQKVAQTESAANIAILLETKQFEEVVCLLTQEELKAFLQALMQVCDALFKIDQHNQQEDLSLAKVGMGILKIGVVVVATIGITGIGKNMLTHIQNQTEAIQNPKLQVLIDLAYRVSSELNISFFDALKLIQEVR